MTHNFKFDLYGKTYEGVFTFDGNVNTVYNKIKEYTNSKQVDLYSETKDIDAIFKYIQDNLYIDLGVSLLQNTGEPETIELILR